MSMLLNYRRGLFCIVMAILQCLSGHLKKKDGMMNTNTMKAKTKQKARKMMNEEYYFPLL